MNAQVWILSADALFARMLMLELKMQRLDVVCTASLEGAQYADVVLLDLDSALPPPHDRYREMIGFSRNATAPDDESRRLCSLILRRPFDMLQLCNEVLSLLSDDTLHADTVRRTVIVDVVARNSGGEVTLSDGKCIPLGPKEFAVLSLLWRRRGEAVSREEISREIGESTANKVDVYVCMLRKKLEAEDLRYIKTVRGQGYCLI